MNYFLTDHLGSVRVIVDGNGVVLERNDYYPFGMRHVRSDYPQLAVNCWKYNGKEQQVTGDLGYLDYGARMYDSGLGRWFGMDLMSEDYYSWSVYNYTLCNPVKHVDPNGMWVDNYQLLLNGRIKLLEKTDDEFDVLYASKSGRLGSVYMGNCLQVNDRTILKSLSGIKSSNPIYRTTGSNKYALTSNLEDAFSVFKFVADNSTVEWGLRGLRKDGKNLYMLRTSLLTGSISSFDFNFKTSEITFDMHSHPGTGERSKRASGYNNDGYLGDMKSVTKRYEDLRKIGREYPEEFPPHYIYHVLSQNLYQYTPWNPSIFVNKIGSAKMLKRVVKILNSTR